MRIAWLALVLSATAETATEGPALDKVLSIKGGSVENLTSQITKLSNQVLNANSNYMIPGTPEVEKVAQKLEVLVGQAAQSGSKLAADVLTDSTKAAGATAAYEMAKLASAAACQDTTACSAAAQQVADTQSQLLRAAAQFKGLSRIVGPQADKGTKQEQDQYYALAAQIPQLSTNQANATMHATRLCGEKKTPCQVALNTTVTALHDELQAQDNLLASKDTASELSMVVKRAEELLRPLEMKDLRLFELRRTASMHSSYPAFAVLGAGALFVLAAGVVLLRKHRTSRTRAGEVLLAEE